MRERGNRTGAGQISFSVRMEGEGDVWKWWEVLSRLSSRGPGKLRNAKNDVEVDWTGIRYGRCGGLALSLNANHVMTACLEEIDLGDMAYHIPSSS